MAHSPHGKPDDRPGRDQYPARPIRTLPTSASVSTAREIRAQYDGHGLTPSHVDTLRDVLVVALHGVMSDGSKSIDRLRTPLEMRGAIFKEMDYGFQGLLGARLVSPRVAEKLARWSLSFMGPVVAVGHSNGCNIIHQAVANGAYLPIIVLINPALHVNAKWPQSVRRIIVYYSPHDKAVWWARVLRRFSPGNLVFGKHPWGAAGREGFTRGDGRLEQWNLSELFHVPIGHSDAFSDAHIGALRAHVGKRLAEAWAQLEQ